MNTINRKRTQLSVMAAAALAIFAVAAVMLLAGGNPAQADTANPTSDNGNYVVPEEDVPGDDDPTPTPRTHATPEPCPGETSNPNLQAAHLVDSGHIALFDVYWNPVEGELTNNPCPPTVTHVEAVRKKGKIVTPARDDRSPSSVNIEETIIHIPSSAKVVLSTSTTYTETKYQDLWDADKAENRDTDGDGTPDGVGDRIVWALPACPPDGSSETVDLCLSFSAALLEAGDDWDGDIEYHVDHIHQTDIDRQDPRYVLAYNVPADGAPTPYVPLWNSFDARVATVPVEPGGYDRPTWFFTDRGTYEFQVHIRGNPNNILEYPVTQELSVSSDVREYIIHVGAEADLSVGVTATPDLESGDNTLDPGDNVAIAVTAGNAGPDTAPDTKVAVVLPEGLTYSSHDPATATYDSATGVWTIGELGVTNDDNTETADNSPTLTITAEVASDTHGQELTTKATISATETLQITETVTDQDTGQEKQAVVEYHVPVADLDPSNDTNTGTVTVASSPNVNPIFRIERTVGENAAAGANIGGPALVRDPDDATHEYTIVGPGADNFVVDGTGQVSVAQGAVLNYECQTIYPLTLQVSDGKNADGDPDDSAIDHAIGLDILVSDDTAETDANVVVSVKASKSDPVAGDTVTLTAAFLNYSSCAPSSTQLDWLEDVRGQNGATERVLGRHVNHIEVQRSTAGTNFYILNGTFDQGSRSVNLNFSVTWR